MYWLWRQKIFIERKNGIQEFIFSNYDTQLYLYDNIGYDKLFIEITLFINYCLFMVLWRTIYFMTHYLAYDLTPKHLNWMQIFIDHAIQCVMFAKLNVKFLSLSFKQFHIH